MSDIYINDIETLLKIKKLLYDDGFTIKGAVSIIDKNNQKNIMLIYRHILYKLHYSNDILLHLI